MATGADGGGSTCNKGAVLVGRSGAGSGAHDARPSGSSLVWVAALVSIGLVVVVEGRPARDSDLRSLGWTGGGGGDADEESANGSRGLAAADGEDEEDWTAVTTSWTARAKASLAFQRCKRV